MALRTMMVACSPLAAALLLSGCGTQTQDYFTAAEICKASMATALEHDISTIDFVNKNGKLIYVSYTNQKDWSKSTYRCKVEGEHVLWAPTKGAWQNETEGTISYSATPTKLTVVENKADGEQISNEYKVAQLRVES